MWQKKGGERKKDFLLKRALEPQSRILGEGPGSVDELHLGEVLLEGLDVGTL